MAIVLIQLRISFSNYGKQMFSNFIGQELNFDTIASLANVTGLDLSCGAHQEDISSLSKTHTHTQPP